MIHHLTRALAGLACLACLAGISISQGADNPPEPSTKVEIRGGVVQGFTHPGIGLTREMLANARAQVLAKRDPWYSGFRKLAAHPGSAEVVSCGIQSAKDPSQPDSDTFDSRGMVARLKHDADKAYRQALMYYFTGKEAHRANAMHIIRVWSKLDPKKFKSFAEDHIHASYPVQDLIMAAELIRYTSAPNAGLQWTVKDTEAFTHHFVVPAVATFFNHNGWFMNQNGYPLTAAMAGDIFTNDRPNYQKRVEWFTVNKDAPNKGWSSSILHLARRVDTNAITGEKVQEPVVQLMEMGRDQAHAGDDVEIFMNTARMINAQGTRVDPATGTISTKNDALGPYEFLNERILAAADQFCRFMLGYDTPWVPAAYDIAPDGSTRAIYPRIADNYRGRIRGFDFWDAYFHQAWRRGVDMAKNYPYYHEAFSKRIVNSDFDWISIPGNVSGEGARVPQTVMEPEVVEIEQRSTRFDSNAAVVTESDVSFVRVKPTASGTRIAILSCDTDRKTLWLRIRTNGVATLDMSGFSQPWLLPDTRGEWRLVAYTMGELERFGDIVYFIVKGAPPTQVDLDQLVRKPDAKLHAPEYRSGRGELRVVAYVGAPVQLDFAATGNEVRVTSLDMPKDAALNSLTGLFQWHPPQAGEFEFVVMAAEHESITPRRVRITVTADPKQAVERIADAHDPAVAYVAAGLQRCKELYDDAHQSLNGPDDQAFYPKLAALQAAFDRLEPLTPRLRDGSMDFPKVVVSSNIGAQIALLTDGNDDTFPVYFLAKDLNYIFDFGAGFQFSASAFALEGRLNFENRAQDTAFFGSDDSQHWTQLTPEITQLPIEMTRVAVSPPQLDARFRFLKIAKTSRKSAGLFEPAELRIYGQRHEKNQIKDN
ncbi:MAG: hypothetical protein WCJ14_06225 [Verrucomicrobiota bacterium]